MSMFKRIDHIEIVTDKLEPSVAFYTEVLGFTVGARDRIERPGGGILNIVYLGLGGTTVELMSYDGVAVAPQPEMEHLGYRMMALEVEDMIAAQAYLQTKGVDIVWGPVFRDTYARAEICDPNGYRIELRHWL
jgi:glyoxylase I family protein